MKCRAGPARRPEPRRQDRRRRLLPRRCPNQSPVLSRSLLQNDTIRCRISAHVNATAPSPSNVRASGRPRSARIDEVVLRTTLRHLAERGYAGMSINAIAAELGVSKPTIYLRWPSKMELALAAVTSLYVDRPEAATGDVRTDLVAHLRSVKRVHDTVGIGLAGS